MARSWSLPEEFATYIEGHTKLDQFLPEAKKNPGHVAVGLSSLLPPVNDNEWAEREKCLSVYQQVAPPGSPTIQEFLGKIDVEFAEFAPVLKLVVPKRSLMESVSTEPVKA